MKMPGFTAEVSLYQMRQRYVTGSANFLAASRGIYPAYQDQNCLNDCLHDCGTVCAGETGLDKSACIHTCARDNAECRISCDIPGNPPVTSGGGGGGCSPLLPSGSGLPIYGNFCGPDHGDPTKTPVDAVDAACMVHDACYDATNYFNCGCDRTLIADMPAAIAASPCLEGKVAGAAVMGYFAQAPCFCNVTLFCPPFGGPCLTVPIPGRGGMGSTC